MEGGGSRAARAARRRWAGAAAPAPAGAGARAAPTLVLDEAPGHLLRRCHQRSREIYEELIGHRGLSRQQFAVLIAISQHPAASLTRISAATGFDRNTLAEMIGRLRSSGHVSGRRSARDARAIEIELTPAGARFVREMTSAAHEVQRRILEPLPAALRPVFVRCLRMLLGLDRPPAQAATDTGGSPSQADAGVLARSARKGRRPRSSRP